MNKASPAGTFASRYFAGAPTLTAADLNATFANPYSSAVSAPTGAITYSIVSATGAGASPASGTIGAGTVLTVGTYVVRATYPGDANYHSAILDAVFTVGPSPMSTVDTDGDGMADVWEMDYFGNLSQGAGGDYDNDGFTNLVEYHARSYPNYTSSTPGNLLNSSTAYPAAFTVLAKGTGWVTVTTQSGIFRHYFSGTPAGEWGYGRYDVQIGSVGDFTLTMQQGQTFTITTSADAGITDYQIRARGAATAYGPANNSDEVVGIELAGQYLDKIFKSEMNAGQFTARMLPSGIGLPFATIDTSAFVQRRILKFGLGESRTGRPCGLLRFDQALSVVAGPGAEEAIDTPLRTQVKVPAGFVDINRTYAQLTITYYDAKKDDQTAITKGGDGFYSFAGATPLATYGLSGSFDIGRGTLTRTIGGITAIYEFEGTYTTSDSAHEFHEYGNSNNTMEVWQQFQTTTGYFWSWRTQGTPRGGLVKAVKIHDRTVMRIIPNAPNYTYQPVFIHVSHYLGTTDTAPLGYYQRFDYGPGDFTSVNQQAAFVGYGADQIRQAGRLGGPATSYRIERMMNNQDSLTLTEYYGWDASNSTNNLDGQPKIALNKPKKVRQSFLDLVMDVSNESPSELITTYTYLPEQVDGEAVTATSITKQGTVTLGQTSYSYSTGTLNSLATVTTQATKYASASSTLVSSTRAYSGRLADRDFRGKLLSTTNADGSKTSYAYQRGTLSGATWTASASGPHFLLAELSGKTGSGVSAWLGTFIDPLDLDPNRSVVSEKIIDAEGQLIREASYLYTGGSSFTLLNATYLGYDRIGNLRMKANAPITMSGDTAATSGRIFFEASYSGFLKTWEKNEQGIRQSYGYDAFSRVQWSKREAASYSGHAIAETTTTYIYDEVGRVKQEILTGAGEADVLVTSSTYDTAGRPKTISKPGGFTTTINYDSPTQTTTCLPGGGTKIDVIYKDGRPKTTSGTAVPDSTTSYAYNSSGQLVTIQTIAGQTGTETMDWLGRAISATAATWSGGTRTTFNTYHATTGQLTKTEVKNGAAALLHPRLFEYDAYARLYREGLDADGSGTISPSADFGVKEYESSFLNNLAGYGANWFLYAAEKIWPYAGANAGTFRYASQSYTQVSGLTAAVAARSIAYDFDRNRTESTTALDRANKLLTTATTTAGTNVTLTQLNLNGFTVSATNAQGHTVVAAFDGLGRPEATTDPRTGTSSVIYHPNTTLVQFTIAPDYKITSMGYDSAGRLASQMDPAGKLSYFQYDVMGRLTHTWGDTVNPVKFQYNSLGQKIKMHTYRSGSWTGATLPSGFALDGDTTIWTYQASTGLMTSKMDALGRTTSFEYDDMARAKKRTDARGWVTHYTFTLAGQPYQTDYTDAVTSDVTYSYDRAGRVNTVADAAGTRTFAYYDTWSDGSYEAELRNKSARVKTESLPGYFGSHALNYDYQYAVANRANGALNSLKIDSGSLYTINYAFDNVGRLGSLTYNSGTPFTYGYLANANLIDTVAQGASGYKRDFDYETTANRVSVLKNQFGSVSASTVESRLTHDLLGRRNTEKTAGTNWMSRLGRASEAGVHADYQYTSRSELDYSAKFQLTGAWGVGAFRANTDRDYTYDPIGNRLAQTEAGAVGSYLPNSLNQYTAAPGAPALGYDNNGNLTNDGTRGFEYDGENRLIKVTQGLSVWNYAYDYLGRRIRKWGTGLTEQKFFYDGWNLIAETDAAGTLTRRYVWGLDVSGSLQGAGGVGGLLQIQDGSATYHPIYDASHNVVGLFDGAGNVNSAYEYDPFGKSQMMTGGYAAANPFRFSTKYTDAETGFTYYGHRYYSAALGRFINRDPIEEKGGINLYGFCGNDGVNRWDLLGMIDPVSTSGPNGDADPNGPTSHQRAIPREAPSDDQGPKKITAHNDGDPTILTPVTVNGGKAPDGSAAAAAAAAQGLISEQKVKDFVNDTTQKEIAPDSELTGFTNIQFRATFWTWLSGDAKKYTEVAQRQMLTLANSRKSNGELTKIATLIRAIETNKNRAKVTLSVTNSTNIDDFKISTDTNASPSSTITYNPLYRGSIPSTGVSENGITILTHELSHAYDFAWLRRDWMTEDNSVLRSQGSEFEAVRVENEIRVRMGMELRKQYEFPFYFGGITNVPDYDRYVR